MIVLARLVRLIAGWLDLVIFTTILWLLAWLPRRWTRSWYPRLFPVWCRSFARALRVELYVHQHYRDMLPANYLLIANHPSAFEDVGIPALFPVVSLAKREVRDWWIVGRISERAETLYVARGSHESRRAAARDIEAVLRGGQCVAVYPEGGCLGRRIASRFHYGTFEIAIQAGVPVLPVFIHYEAQARFEWLEQTLPRKIWQILTARNHRANYHVFDPLDPADYADAQAFHDAVHAQYLRWQHRFLE